MDDTPRRTEAALAATKATAPSPSTSSSIPPPAHQSDADEDDENVKQLGDCSAVYLALQVILSPIPSSSLLLCALFALGYQRIYASSCRRFCRNASYGRIGTGDPANQVFRAFTCSGCGISCLVSADLILFSSVKVVINCVDRLRFLFRQIFGFFQVATRGGDQLLKPWQS